jgi:putative DNA primase/helicase
VLVLTDVPLPLEISEILVAADLAPSPADLMLAAGGVALENAADAAAAYPQLWGNRETAKTAFRKGQMGDFSHNQIYMGESPIWHEYRRDLPRHRGSGAWYDPAMIPDPVAWLTNRLGPLAWCNTSQGYPQTSIDWTQTDGISLTCGKEMAILAS